jgi:hypothetical protein
MISPVESYAMQLQDPLTQKLFGNQEAFCQAVHKSEVWVEYIL